MAPEELPEFTQWGPYFTTESGERARSGLGGSVMRVGGVSDGSGMRRATLADLAELLSRMPFAELRATLPDEFRRAERDATLEEAAAVCDNIAASTKNALRQIGCDDCAAAIRALRSKP
jgi:hypothetical protein